jgi:TadE-like protein
MRVPVRGSDAGAAAVEFALVSVLLFTLLFGIVQYGYFFLQSSAAEHAAREGARAAALGIDDCADWQALVVDRGGSADVQSATALGGQVRGDDITVTVTWDPLDFGLPFVPFLGGTQPEEAAVTRAERIGAITSGCP